MLLSKLMLNFLIPAKKNTDLVEIEGKLGNIP